ncbi:MAG: hypothetical protein KC912_22515 [Proteobacteria bacterium]|nr:hypothetical protein [Pseudomonadota bacterium]
MNHTWSRRGAQVSVILEAIGGDLVSSRLLHGPEGSWIWVEGTRTDASPARAAEWIDRLAPGYILSSAFLAGFGGAVQPPSGCRTVKGRLLCVDAQPEQADEATVFEDLLRTKDGDWLPGRIRRYHAGKLVDHAVVLQVRLSDPAPEHWFDPNYPRIDASP